VREREQLHITLPIVIPRSKIMVEMVVVCPRVKVLSSFHGKTILNTVLTSAGMPQAGILSHVSVRFHYVVSGE